MAAKKNNDICCFDTNVIIEYLKGRVVDPVITNENEIVHHEVDRLLNNKSSCLYIPAPVLLELLLKVDNQSDREEILELMSGVFKVIPFDFKAAMHGGIAFSEKYKDLKRQDAGFLNIRDHLKTDVQIMSIALSRNATTMYSDDGHMKKIQCDGIKIIGIDEISYQLEIFER